MPVPLNLAMRVSNRGRKVSSAKKISALKTSLKKKWEGSKKLEELHKKNNPPLPGAGRRAARKKRRKQRNIEQSQKRWDKKSDRKDDFKTEKLKRGEVVDRKVVGWEGSNTFKKWISGTKKK